MMGFGWLGMLVMGLGMLLFWGLLIFVAVLLVRMLFPSGSNPVNSNHEQKSARQILDERYARGEITRQQYDLMKEDISLE